MRGKSLVQGARYSIAAKRAIIEIPVSTGKDASGGVLGGFELAGRAADAVPDLVVFLDGITRRGGNNDRLSTLWREVISLAGVARALSKSKVQSIS